MFSPIFLLTLLPLVASDYVAPMTRTKNPKLNADLKAAATNFDRHRLLPENSDWYYNIYEHPNFNATGGSVINADAATFTALTGLGISIATLKIGPCGMLPFHEHPRASNVVIGIKGSTTSWMIGENGVDTVVVEIVPYRVTVFPIGSVHVMQNNGCEEAILISSLSSDDSGTNNILRSASTVPDDIIRASFGDSEFDVAKFRAMVPEVGTGVIQGSTECLKRCRIKP